MMCDSLVYNTIDPQKEEYCTVLVNCRHAIVSFVFLTLHELFLSSLSKVNFVDPKNNFFESRFKTMFSANIAAQQEALRREIERLRKVYQQHNLKGVENGAPPPSSSEANNGSMEKEQLAN